LFHFLRLPHVRADIAGRMEGTVFDKQIVIHMIDEKRASRVKDKN
jgi:hypothetical protein